MAYYLLMDGIDDRIATPSMTITQVILDIAPTKTTHNRRIWGLPFGAEFLQSNTDFNDTFSAGVTVYVNDVQKTSGTNFITSDTRQTIKIVAGSAKTNVNYIFSNNTTTIMGGKIYSVKFYNGAALVAHYDMSTQTVQDQSGNGNHATLTGGTWVDDGVGGGSTIDAGTITISADGSLTSQASRVLTSNAFFQADTTFTASAQRILSGVSGISAETDLNAIASRILTSNINLSGDSSLSAEADVFGIGISINLSAETSLTASGSKVIQGQSTISANGEVIATGSLTLSGEVSLMSDSELSVFMGDYYEQVIRRTMNVATERKVNINITRSYRTDINI